MRPMLEKVSSAYLGIYVAVVDAFVWLGGLPYVLYCKMLFTADHRNVGVMLGILTMNAVIVTCMFYALIATNELVRRGIRRRAPSRS